MRRHLVLIALIWGLVACSSNGGDGGGAGVQATGTSGTLAGAGSGAGTGAGAGGTSAGTSGAGTLDGGAPTDGSANDDAAMSAADGGSDAGTPMPFACRAPTKAATSGNTCPASNPVELKVSKLADSFDFPIFVTAAPGDEARLFVVERHGTIQVVKNGAKLADPFIDLSVVSTSNEQGLLGMAFDPDFETTGRFFVDYIQMQTFGTRSVVESYTVKTSKPDEADETTKKLILDIEDPEWNHNGGMIAFGPDNCLYVASGDGGGGDDNHTANGADGNGQSLETGLGKLLRVDVDNPSAAAPGNLDGAGIPWIWDYGLRNPWRFSFDRDTGDLYIADVGQDVWEEINVMPRGHGHNNYGWKFIEGKHCRGSATPGTPAMCSGHDYDDFVPPVHDYQHAGADDCVIGGYVYRGAEIPSLQGWYLFADHGSNKVWAMVWNGTATCGTPIDLTTQLAVVGKITSFGEDAVGELYITTESGNVYRIDAK